MFSKESGLSNSEVKIRKQQYGANVLPEKPSPSHFSILIQQLKSPLVYVLLSATAVTFIVGHFADALVILLAVFINTILGYIQESKASNALDALKHYVTSQTTVIRDGKRVSIDTTDIVPGDTVVLDQGTKVPADGKLTFANRFYLDEAVLTGESVPVNKNVDDKVFMGTVVSSGQATFLVERTGQTTNMGKIALQIQEIEEDTPLQKQLKTFSKQLVFVICVLTVIVFIIGVLYKFSLTEMLTTSVALAVSSIPEGLLVSLTVVLAIGMQKIIKHRGLVRKLLAAETLGGVTVICADKTGTLTQGKMKVVDYIGDKKKLAEQVLLANDLDDPMVIAAFEWGRTMISDSVSEHTRFDSIPFSPKERFFTSLNKWTDKNNILFVSGAPEILLEWSTLPEAEKKEIIKSIDELSRQGKRLIGFARKEVSLNKKTVDKSDVKENLNWIGILAFSDPVRPGVREAFEQTLSAGIKTIVITGDYPKTSEFILRQLGIPVSGKEIMLGSQLEKLSVEQLSQKVKSVKLFARTTPDQKLKIVEALKKNGEVVAMMGDGVNDAPALHKADIGVVVENATDVAQESADLVLLDSNFSTIVSAIEEGRVMFENMRKIIIYLMSDAFVEIIVVIGGISFGLPLPITAVQILWINLISDGFPNLALTVDPKRTGVMKEKPRLSQERLINKWMIYLIGLVSLIAGLFALSTFVITYKLTNDLLIARSFTFIVIGLDSLIYVFSVRALMTPFWKSHFFENKWLVTAVIAGLSLQILPFASHSLRQFFGLTHLELNYWLIAGGLSVLLFFVIEVFKASYNFKIHKI